MTKFPKIVFFGSGPVAYSTLVDIEPHFDIEAIITKPRAETFRGTVPVLDFAQEKNIAVFTPKNKLELTELFGSKKFQSQIGILVDYGIIISKTVINSFSKGIVNSHFSILPQWRGADPITFSVLSGQKTAGVSLMIINEKMDEGDLIIQKEIPILSNITTPKLTDELINLSNSMLIEYLPKYFNGKIKPYHQKDEGLSYSRKLTKEDSILDIRKPANILEREVRAFTGWPKSRISLFGHDIIVKKTRIASDKNDGKLILECGDNSFLEILQLTAPSGRTMSGADFLRGYNKS